MYSGTGDIEGNDGWLGSAVRALNGGAERPWPAVVHVGHDRGARRKVRGDKVGFDHGVGAAWSAGSQGDGEGSDTGVDVRRVEGVGGAATAEAPNKVCGRAGG